MTKREYGMQRLREIVEPRADEIISNFKHISPDFANNIIEFVYADL